MAARLEKSRAARFKISVLPLAAAFLAGLALLGLHSIFVERGWGGPQKRVGEELAAESAPGVEDQRIARAPFYYDADGGYWVDYATQLVESGQWRLRHTTLDNPPHGRPVCWSQLPIWWLVGTGVIQRVIEPHLDMAEAIARGAIWSNLLVAAFALLGGALMLARRVSLAAGVLFPLLLGSSMAVADQVVLYRPDHHCWQILALVLLLCGALPCGLVGGTPVTRRDRFVIVSAVGGAMGLWLATVQFLPVLGAMALGAALGTVGGRRAAEAPAWSERDWRLWGRLGCVMALFFFALENAPVFWSPRLEVNHPLYALAWLAAGEWAAEWRRPVGVRWRRLGALTVAGLAVPVVWLVVPTGMFVLKDEAVLRIHSAIDEFRTPFAVSGQPWGFLFRMVGGVFLSLAGLVVFLGAHRFGGWARLRGLWPVALPTVVLLGAGLWQLRWLALAAAAGACLVAALGGVALEGQRGTTRRWVWAWVALLCVGVPTAVFVQDWQRVNPSLVPRELALAAATREVALLLRKREGAGQSRVIVSNPYTMGRLPYDGAGQVVGSLYWENREGLRHYLLFFERPPGDEPLLLARKLGITHVIVPMEFVHPGPLGRDSLGYALLQPEPREPPWLKRIFLGGGRFLANVPVRVYRVDLGMLSDPL